MKRTVNNTCDCFLSILFIYCVGSTDLQPVSRSFEEIYIYKNRIINNSYGIIALSGHTNTEITIHNGQGNYGNNLSGNSIAGINNAEPTALINAANNWWGDISGPYNAVDNPSGLGIDVIGNVIFWPWFEFGVYNNGNSIPGF